MEKSLLAAIFLGMTLLVAKAPSQPVPDPLDSYIENAKTIIVAKCIASGPVDKLFRSMVDLEIIHVVKGDPELRTLSTRLRGGLVPGDTYLIRIPDLEKSAEKSGFGSEGSNVVPVSGNENMEVLKTLSPRIVVLRTMNRRIDELDSIIRRSTYEIEGLKAIKKNN